MLVEDYEADPAGLDYFDHALSVEQWHELLKACYPSQYTDPPPPKEPAFAITTQSRVEVYRQRVERGEHLYHQGDLWRDGLALEDLFCSMSAKRCRNGEDAPEEDLVLDREIVNRVNERGQKRETGLTFDD